MLAYFGLYFISTSLLIYSILFRNSLNKCYFLLLLTIVFFGGFRYAVGVDYFNYVEYFDLLKLDKHLDIEISFLILSKVVNYLDGDSQVIFFMYTLLSVFFISKFISYFSLNKMISLYVYITFPVFFIASFNGIRQFLAIAIFAYAIKFIVERNIYKYIFFILLASLFHKTAITTILLYFILNKELKIKQFFIILMAYTLILFFFEKIVILIGFEFYLSFINQSISNKINPLVFILIIFFLIIYNLKFEYKEIALNLIFIAILLGITPIFVTVQDNLIIRLSSYFTIAIIFILPNLIYLIKNNCLKGMYILIIIVFGGSYLFRNIYFMGEDYKLVPYQININLF